MNPIGIRLILGKILASIDPTFFEVATFVVAAATFVIAFLTLYETRARPRIRVYFWDPDTSEISTQRAMGTSSTATLHFLFRNLGDSLGFYNRAATLLTAYIYFPRDWEIEEARRPESRHAKTREVFHASPSGHFANMQYIAVPSAYDPTPPTISIVSYQEDVLCEVDVRVPPSAAGVRSTLFCQMTSREGDLGVHSLHVDVVSADKEEAAPSVSNET